MDENTLYWLFSTIAQSYGAIIGIIGLLVVYRLETQSRLRESITASLMAEDKIRDAFLNVKATGWSAEDMSYHYNNPDPGLEKSLDKLLDRTVSSDLKDGVTRIDNSIKLGTTIREKFSLFVKFHLGLIIGPIILIHIVPLFFSDGQTFIRPIVIFIIFLVILIVVLSISCKMIWTMAMTLLDEEKKGG